MNMAGVFRFWPIVGIVFIILCCVVASWHGLGKIGNKWEHMSGVDADMSMMGYVEEYRQSTGVYPASTTALVEFVKKAGGIVGIADEYWLKRYRLTLLSGDSGVGCVLVQKTNPVSGAVVMSYVIGPIGPNVKEKSGGSSGSSSGSGAAK